MNAIKINKMVKRIILFDLRISSDLVMTWFKRLISC